MDTEPSVTKYQLRRRNFLDGGGFQIHRCGDQNIAAWNLSVHTSSYPRRLCGREEVNYDTEFSRYKVKRVNNKYRFHGGNVAG